MKLGFEELEGGLRARVAGDLEVASCACLESFWNLRLSSAPALELDLSGIEQVDPDGCATLLALLQRQLEEGGRVALHGAPEAVRRALADTGLASAPGLRLEA